jgi:EAL domain-containing protein (putative c-di-GMP-specific phosphodiesterase class I)
VTGGHLQTSPGRVLLVDDEPAILRAYQRALEGAGFHVVTACDGGEATERLGEGGFDAVLSDISMPTLTGIELLRVIRQRDPDLPVIIMTGSPAVSTATEAIEFGILAYLIKPVVVPELVAMVERAVKMHRLARVKREALEYLNNSAADWVGDRSELEAHFTRALDTAWMAYQPIVSVSERRIFAYEALVRPTHPALPNPGALIRAAEQLGRVHQMGRKLREMVAQQMDHAGAPLVFVNLHGHDLTDDQLLSVDSPLAAMAHNVVLEITERACLDDIKDLEARIRRLRTLGFRIAIDDLGAGYSGLALFAQLQPEIVKIDMSLIRNVDQEPMKRRLVRSMISLCSEMAIKVVCEGVETEAERDSLLEIGADLIQGYLYARPSRTFPVVNFGPAPVPAGTTR